MYVRDGDLLITQHSSHPPIPFVTRLNKAAVLALCNIIKFLYGFLFGAFIWYVMVHPYSRYLDFEQESYVPEYAFCLITGLLFASFRWLRTIMVLFLPSMIGSASQNYIIVLLLASLLRNPVANIGYNSVESVRVIGCSLMMTFEQLKERAKLMLNPIVEVLSDRNRSDLEPIREDLLQIEQTILEMRNEAEFNRNLSGASSSAAVAPSSTPSPEEVLDDVRSRLRLEDRNRMEEIVGKTMELLNSSTSLTFDTENLGLKMAFEPSSLRKYLRAQNVSLFSRERLKGEFNFTEIMYQNCLGIFRRAKGSCEASVAEMQESCRKTVGVVFATIWCLPITFNLGHFCPWIMDQILDESNLCQSVRDLKVAPKVRLTNWPLQLNETGESIDEIYAKLESQLANLNDELLVDDSSSAVPPRLELNIAMNSKMREVFMQTRAFVRFITDKYQMRHLFAQLVLFLYDLYTTLTFLCIIWQAYSYWHNYLNEIKFDNHYIAGEFVELDKRRGKLDRREAVLPLTEDESQKYISTYTCKRRTNEERHSQRVNCSWLAFFSLVTLSLLYLDNIFSSILASVQEHAFIRYKEVGRHQLNISVHGEGSIARLVRRLTSHLNSAYDMERYSSTKKCLPGVELTTTSFYLNFLYLSLSYLFIDQVSIYAMRFRHITAGYFYPGRERRRVEFLHRLIVSQRQRIEDLGVKSYIESKEDGEEPEEQVYTIRDALGHLGECVLTSLACGCCKRRRARKEAAVVQSKGRQK